MDTQNNKPDNDTIPLCSPPVHFILQQATDVAEFCLKNPQHQFVNGLAESFLEVQKQMQRISLEDYARALTHDHN